MNLLFQPLPVIILEPVSKSFFEAPLKLITAVLQLLTTDISRNLEFLHSRRTDTHWRAKKHGSSSHRHDYPVRYIRNKLSQACNLLHSLYDMLNGISRLKATVINLQASILILHSSFFTLHFRFPQKETDKLLYIDTSLDGILSARVSKLMTTDSPIQSGEITIPPPNTTLGRTMVSRRFYAPEIEKIDYLCNLKSRTEIFVPIG